MKTKTQTNKLSLPITLKEKIQIIHERLINITEEINITENRIVNSKCQQNSGMIFYYELNLDTFENTKEMLENKFEELLKQIDN